MIIKEKSVLKGRIRTIECDAIKYPTYESVEYAIKNKEALFSEWIDNLIPTVGLTATLNNMGGQSLTANEGQITYGAVGTDDTAVSLSDTTLGTEIARVQLATRSVSVTTLTLRAFFNTATGNGNWKEYGLFGEDASGVADSGTMFEHALLTKEKTALKTITVLTEITIS